MKIENSIRRKFEELEENYQVVRTEVKDLLKPICETNQWLFTDRIKSDESFALKIFTGRYPKCEIDDFYACTVVVQNLLSIDQAVEIIESLFEVIERKPKEVTHSKPTDFFFDGLRFYCNRKAKIGLSASDKLPFEIQVRTFLEHAWSVATHDFSYKGRNISWAKERVSAQIKAILDSADISIYDMETISDSKFLRKQNPKYDKLAETMNFIIQEFNVNNAISLPNDVKRLSEDVDNMLNVSMTSLEQLREYLEKETADGRGYKTTNLSIYSIILLAILNHGHKKNLKATFSHSERYRLKPIVVPRECDPEETLKAKGYSKLLFL